MADRPPGDGDHERAELPQDNPLAQHERFHKSAFALAGIPQAQPGPNAFAQRARERERHHLLGNAFYAQAVAQRKATPPAAVHPALRNRSNSDASIRPPRDSRMTTMSPFINAGEPEHEGEILKLVPPSEEYGRPTLRDELEHKQAQKQPQTDAADKITTVAYSPKAKSAVPTRPAPMTKASFAKDPALASAAEQSKPSPKKKLFERLRLSGTKSSSSPILPTHSAVDMLSVGDKIPLKAQVVLGTAPRPEQSVLVRSPSKAKAFFSRKSVDGTDSKLPKASFFRRSIGGGESPILGSVSSRTSHSPSIGVTRSNSKFGGQVFNQDQIEDTAALAIAADVETILKSSSLHYFDKSIPPTPPAKNTPPHVKVKQNEEATITVKSAQKPGGYQSKFELKTGPEMVQVRSFDGLNYFKFGVHGNDTTPTVIKRPSIHSMYASMFPNLSTSTSYEELKSCVDAFGLEGLSRIPAKLAEYPELFYSPSIYPIEWEEQAESDILSPAFKHTPGPVLPTIPESLRRVTPSSQADAFTSPTAPHSAETIKIGFADLVKQYNSRYNLKDPPSIAHHVSSETSRRLGIDRPYRRDSEFGGILPFHGETQSPGHSPERAGAFSQLEAFRLSPDLSVPKTPRSFENASAAPSPLRVPEVLSDKKYEKTPGKLRNRNRNQAENTSAHTPTPSEDKTSRRNVFDNAPDLFSVPIGGRKSPVNYKRMLSLDDNGDSVDPEKKVYRSCLEPKLDVPDDIESIADAALRDRPPPSATEPKPVADDILEVMTGRSREQTSRFVNACVKKQFSRAKGRAKDVEKVKKWQKNLDELPSMMSKFDGIMDRLNAEMKAFRAEMQEKFTEMHEHMDACLIRAHDEEEKQESPYIPHADLPDGGAWHGTGQDRFDLDDVPELVDHRR